MSQSSSVHALSMVSPFFRTLPLAEHGLEWITPAVPLAHPLDNCLSVRLFKENRARVLFSGLCAHANIPLEKTLTAAFGLPVIPRYN